MANMRDARFSLDGPKGKTAFEIPGKSMRDAADLILSTVRCLT